MPLPAPASMRRRPLSVTLRLELVLPITEMSRFRRFFGDFSEILEAMEVIGMSVGSRWRCWVGGAYPLRLRVGK